MPILVLGQFRGLTRRRLVCGFTLLELMVVLLVVGISLGLVTPHFMQNDEDVLKEESTRLVALMAFAADSASSRGQWLAWSPTAHGYRFSQRNEEKNVWQPITTDEVLRERNLPDGVRLVQAHHQQSIRMTDTMITLSPTGIHAPFQITLSTGKATRIIRGNLLGQVEVFNPNVLESLVL